MPDIFLSYAHVDKHWVDTFTPLLEQRVNQYVGRVNPDRVWKDNRLSSNQSFSSEIHQQLNTAQCLVACMSPGYFASDWCKRELTEFSQRVGNETGRVFCIELDEIPQNQKSSLTNHLLGYRFWSQDALSKRSYPMLSTDATFESLLIDLSKDIATQLRGEASSAITKTAVSEASQDNMSIDNEVKKPSLKQSATLNALEVRRKRLADMVSQLQEQYDFETRIEERMRIQHYIDKKQIELDKVNQDIASEGISR